MTNEALIYLSHNARTRDTVLVVVVVKGRQIIFIMAIIIPSTKISKEILIGRRYVIHLLMEQRLPLGEHVIRCFPAEGLLIPFDSSGNTLLAA